MMIASRLIFFPPAGCLGAFLLAVSCQGPPGDGTGIRRLHTELVAPNGRTVGFADLQETDAGVRVEVVANNLQPGVYRYGFFTKPACDPPDFASAGVPFPEPSEVGMLRNMSPALNREVGRLRVDQEGTGRSEEIAEVITLGPGDNSLTAGGGTALVVLKLPTGGERVACGVIQH